MTTKKKTTKQPVLKSQLKEVALPMTAILRVVSEGGPNNVKVVLSDGSQLTNVVSVAWSATVDALPLCTITVLGVHADLLGKGLVKES